MKTCNRLIALVLTLFLTISLAACGAKEAVQDAARGALGGNSGGSSLGGSSSSGSESGSGNSLDDIDWDEYDRAMSEASAYLMSLGLEEDEYGFTQYGVWNSDLLPDCVPREPASGILEIDRTEYKDRHHEDLVANIGGSYNVGNIVFANKDYECHMVWFYCTQAALDEFLAAIAANGFDGFDGPHVDSNNRSIYEWMGNGYYAHMSASPSWDESEDRISCVFEITPTLGNPRPKTFNGNPLPDFGLVMYYFEEMEGYGWNERGGDWQDVSDFWDIFNDRGDLPDSWSMRFDYQFVTMEQAKAYAQKLASSGWSLGYENEGYDPWSECDTYYAQLDKGGQAVQISFRTSYGGSLEVEFGSNSDVFG